MQCLIGVKTAKGYVGSIGCGHTVQIRGAVADQTAVVALYALVAVDKVLVRAQSHLVAVVDSQSRQGGAADAVDLHVVEFALDRILTIVAYFDIGAAWTARCPDCIVAV